MEYENMPRLKAVTAICGVSTSKIGDYLIFLYIRKS